MACEIQTHFNACRPGGLTQPAACGECWLHLPTRGLGPTPRLNGERPLYQSSLASGVTSLTRQRSCWADLWDASDDPCPVVTLSCNPVTPSPCRRAGCGLSGGGDAASEVWFFKTVTLICAPLPRASHSEEASCHLMSCPVERPMGRG